MRELPTELHFTIIEELGRPTHPDAYRLAQSDVSALAQCCLVNRAFCSVAEPLLYSRPVVTPRNLDRFVRTVVESSGRDKPTAFIPTRKARLVKRLALIDFEEEPTLGQIQSISGIFYALSTILERLFLNVWLRPVDYRIPLKSGADRDFSLSGALRSMSNVVEFCTTQTFGWSLDPMPWASKSKLQRIATFETNLHYKLVDTVSDMIELRTYVAGFPRLDATQVFGTPLSSIFDAARPHFRELLIVVDSADANYAEGFKKFMREVMDHPEALAQGERRQMMSVVEAETKRDPIPIIRRERWFADAVLDGTIWTPSRLTWDDYKKPRIAF
ncbi:hypothetical protein FRB90_012740 [Tulasnella sp. 427]|nr:hypothetical protein FRB90_012740 [Tulasnella sp. 427]